MDQDYRDFVNGVLNILSKREGSTVIVLIDGEHGFESFMNAQRISMQLGMLDMGRLVALKTMEAGHTVATSTEKCKEGIEAHLNQTNPKKGMMN